MNYMKLIICIAVCLAATGPSMAQSKIAHIDVQRLLNEMPEMKKAQAELKKLEESYRKDLQIAFQEYQNKAKLYEREAQSKTAAENEKRNAELSDIEKQLGEAQETSGQKLQTRQAELFMPIQDKANKAVKKVAKAQGFHYVLDASTGTNVILADGKDLMEDVKRELGF